MNLRVEIRGVVWEVCGQELSLCGKVKGACVQDRSIGKSGDDPAAVGGGQGHETDVRGDKMVWEVVCLAERANGWVRVKGSEL